jgi:hypothetical protein
MSKEVEFHNYSVAGKRVKCSHCGNETLGRGSALLNTRALTFFNLDWANRAANLLVRRLAVRSSGSWNIPRS